MKATHARKQCLNFSCRRRLCVYIASYLVEKWDSYFWLWFSFGFSPLFRSNGSCRCYDAWDRYGGKGRKRTTKITTKITTMLDDMSMRTTMTTMTTMTTTTTTMMVMMMERRSVKNRFVLTFCSGLWKKEEASPVLMPWGFSAREEGRRYSAK